MRLVSLIAVLSAVSAVILPTHIVTASVETREGGWMPIVQQDHWAIMTIIGEAASEPFAGQVAVARVIRNRMQWRYSSDGTVIGTVLRAKQFSMWDDKARLYAANIELDSEEYSVAAAAWYESSLVLDDPWADAVLYHTKSVFPSWRDAATVKKVATVGAHIFYTDQGGGI